MIPSWYELGFLFWWPNEGQITPDRLRSYRISSSKFLLPPAFTLLQLTEAS
jgi:hypothetical protein